MFKCDKCGKNLKSKMALCGHQAQCCKEKKECSICGKITTISNFEKHIKSHIYDTECLQCGKVVVGKDKKFCNHSCAAKFNNVGKVKNGKPASNCLECGIKLKSSSGKFCSIKCHSIYRYNVIEEKGNCLFCNKIINIKRKYCSRECTNKGMWKIKKKEIEKSGEFECSKNNKHSRRYLLEKCGNKCSICSLEKWMDKPIPLIADHIDGNSENNKIENLRLVCGNCDMQLPTYKSKNKGNGRAWRRKRYAEGKSY